MNPEGMAAWYYQGDGLKLWEEAYAAFNLVPRPGPTTRPADGRMVPEEDQHDRRLQGAQDAHSRASAARSYARAGGTAVLTPGAEIYAALERGVIDAAEWVGPHDDMKLGLHKTARYYYYPGWHEPGTMTEFGFNKKAYDALPVDLQRTLDHAAAAVQVYGLTDFHAKNAIALERLKTEFKGKVEVLQLPAPVLRDLKKLAAEVVREESEKTPMARKVHASFTKFQALVGPWDRVAEGAYHQLVAVTDVSQASPELRTRAVGRSASPLATALAAPGRVRRSGSPRPRRRRLVARTASASSTRRGRRAIRPSRGSRPGSRSSASRTAAT